MAGPSEHGAVFDARDGGVFVLDDSQLEPGPCTSVGGIAEVLSGKQLHAAEVANTLRVESGKYMAATSTLHYYERNLAAHLLVFVANCFGKSSRI